MEIDVKSLYMTGYIGIVLLNIIGGAFFILAFMGVFYGLDDFYIVISTIGGLIMISLMATAYTTKLRRIFYASIFEAEEDARRKKELKIFGDLDEEQNNL